MSEVVFINKAQRHKQAAMATLGFKLSEVVQFVEGGKIAEFIGGGDFARAFIERQRYEVDAGRDEEPLLIDAIYNPVTDANLPQYIEVDTINSAGVFFEEVLEGGEVKYGSVSSSNHSIPIKTYAVAMEYHRNLFLYNQTWKMANVERQVAIAFNALMNHIHLNPILAYSYAAANQTAASAVGATLEEKYLRTIEDAITNSKADATNPRRGPYVLLHASANAFMLKRVLRSVAQQGISLQSDPSDLNIRALVEYDGWSGTRGAKTVSYSGVTANKAYLVSLGHQNLDFQSFIKTNLMRMDGDVDISRLILAADQWVTDFGVYANPIAAVEEITLPT